MKNLLYLFVAVLLFSCNSKEKKDTKKPHLLAENKEIRTYLYGSFVGTFSVEERDTAKPITEENTRINILLKKITESEVTGQRIIDGKSKTIKGQMTKTGNTFYFTLKEYGDPKNDGVFNFEIQKDTLLVGTWTANDPTREVTKRKFTLTKKEFKYDPNLMLPEDDIYVDYVNPKKVEEQEQTEEQSQDEIEKDSINEDEEYESSSELFRAASSAILTINSSTTKLKESQLKNLKKLDLEILRNTIFARHGYAFKSNTIRQFFDYVPWYVPISENVNNQLTETEKQNIELLRGFEKYATDNYDTFGR
ncbi:YARHG domain-containing protein [Flavobacterium zhairuonense]|uniref:YARHG domain-containing protein n=1 Tax=Flavobacterium zhairuonense TaxID=2493631 RepID=UPI001050C278|nr:YARHG domain-containing protein [Flavobacterium zhairuonense]KAF2509221.1 YARHG domain-containing protein [Flavobacterium zhairuonense]